MSDLLQLNSLQRLAARLEAEKAWAAENPALARDWDDALEDCYQRARRNVGGSAANETAADYLARCGVGELEAEILTTPAKLEERLPRAEVKRWIESPKMVLLLHGGTGSGKTIAAAEALLAVRDPKVRHESDGRFITAYRLSRLSYYERDFHDANEQARLLVVDDIGQEQLSGPFLATLDGLLSERIRSKRRTILTADLSVEDFNKRFAPARSRLASRLAAYGVARGCGSEDWRLEP